MQRLVKPLALVCVVMFAIAPILIARAPFEATMGLVYKIFYFHLPVALTMLMSTGVAGIASTVYLFKRSRTADHIAVAAAELTVLFGAMTLVTGPLWARKSWGVYWQWDARITTTLLLELIMLAYLVVRKYGGPGSDKLAAAVAIFGMIDAPIIYKSVDIWRTIHPKTSVLPTLRAEMLWPVLFCLAAFWVLYVVLLAMRVELEEQRTRIDALHLALEA